MSSRMQSLMTVSPNERQEQVVEITTFPKSSGGGGQRYPEPFDVKSVGANIVLKHCVHSQPGKVYLADLATEMTVAASPTDGILFAKIDTTDFAVDSLAVKDRVTQVVEADTEDGKWYFRPLYLLRTSGAGSAIELDLRNSMAPMWT